MSLQRKKFNDDQRFGAIERGERRRRTRCERGRGESKVKGGGRRGVEKMNWTQKKEEERRV